MSIETQFFLVPRMFYGRIIKASKDQETKDPYAPIAAIQSFFFFHQPDLMTTI